MAARLIQDNIIVTAIAPGAFASDMNTAARDADIASRPVTEDWVAQAKADMDKVMADRDAEIASRTDGTSVPVSAVSPA